MKIQILDEAQADLRKGAQFYDQHREEVVNFYQQPLLPLISYRIDF